MDLSGPLAMGACALTRLGPCRTPWCVAWYSGIDAAILIVFFVFLFLDTVRHEGRAKAIRVFLPLATFVGLAITLAVYLALRG
ncbi:DUF2834 domain-containing protein [Luteibacter aegosomatissinici]|uniref:DUF2834 domain-containing protein n=1 Tax=Luteibacter aegosomatissinici TaxID=2911539 RepID=UPI001FF92EE2|nr:DUF2834 domain-containing protein [Luteibacter aegosomatissinici]UPG95876.1 DUF2834 domain-containing protein [Luteibacter aegosomatissinici]